MAKPIIVFIPASYILISEYRTFFDAVSSAGYEIQGIHLPTIGMSSRRGRAGQAPSMYEDSDAIAKIVEALADQGRDIILMGHSYAGVPMSQCTKGLSKNERKIQGKDGGLVRLAYIAALVPPVGGSAAKLLGDRTDTKRPRVSVDENGWMLMEDPLSVAAMCCQDFPGDKGVEAVKAWAKHSARSFADELTHAGYVSLPSSFLFCDEDMAGPPSFQADMIFQMEQSSSRKVDVTHIKSGHCPTMSKVEETLAWTREIVRKTVVASA